MTWNPFSYAYKLIYDLPYKFVSKSVTDVKYASGIPKYYWSAKYGAVIAQYKNGWKYNLKTKLWYHV